MVRFARVSDISAIVNLQQQAATAARWTAAEYQRMLDDKSSVVLVAEGDGSLCGFLAGSGTGSEWELENVVTEQSVRRRGIARRLVESLFTHARNAGAERIFLEVREDNSAARGFYERAGFRLNGRRPGYYGDTAAMLYVCDLR